MKIINIQDTTQKHNKIKTEINDSLKKVNPYAKSDIKFKIINSVNKTFGYDILLDGKLTIHQPNIPVLPGNDGFKTEFQARKVAEFVIAKIRKGEMPPTITKVDLDTLNVLK